MMKMVRFLKLFWLTFILVASLLGCKLGDNEIRGSVNGESPDTTPPSPVQSVIHVSFHNSNQSAPSISWQEAEDSGGSGISHYEISIGTTPGGTDVLPQQDLTQANASSLTGLQLTHGTTYHVTIKAVDNAGNKSEPTTTSWIVDTQVPGSVSNVTDSTTSFDTLSASPLISWTNASDSESGVDHYEVALGSTSGGDEIVTWTAIENITQHQFIGLNLSDGQTYYPKIRAIDQAGNPGPEAIGDGWTTARPVSINFVPNNNVRTTLREGNTLYIGGHFTHIGQKKLGLGEINSSGQLVTTTNWPDINTLSSTPGTIQRIEPDGAGGYYLAGSFTDVGGQARTGLARINSDGSIHSFDMSISGTIYLLKKVGDILYVGGYFTEIDGQPRTNLGAIKISTETVEPWDPAPDGLVYDLLVDGTTIFVGGKFSNISGQARTGLASFDSITGNLNAWGPVLVGYLNNYYPALVYTLAIDSGNLYFGGKFEKIDGTARLAGGAVDASTGALHGWTPPLSSSNDTISKILISGGKAYIGGSFFTVSGCIFCENILETNLATGAPTNWSHSFDMGGLNTDYAIYNMVIIGSTLYAAAANTALGINFDYPGGCTTENNYLFAVNTSSGSIITSYSAGSDGNVFDIEALGGNLLAAGSFKTIGGTPQHGAAAIDMTTGNLLPFDPKPCDNSGNDVFISSLAYDNGFIYMGGRFQYVGDNMADSRAGLARVDGTTGALDSWTMDVASSNGADTLTKVGTKLYASGSFNTIGGQTRPGVARLDLSSNASLETWTPDITGTASGDLVVESGTVYLSGNITQAGVEARTGAAAVSEADGSALAWNPSLTLVGSSLYGLTKINNTIFTIGYFNEAGGLPRYGVASFDATTGNLNSQFDIGTLAPPVAYEAIQWNSDYLVITTAGDSKVVSQTTGSPYSGASSSLPKGFIGKDGNSFYYYSTTTPINGYSFGSVDIFSGQRN